MKEKLSISKYPERLIGIALVLISSFGFSFTGLWKSETVEMPNVSTAQLRDLSMCASAERFDIKMADVYTATDPLAPVLETKWQTNLEITTDSERAKMFFNQGLFMLYAFNHAEADRAFKEAIRLDPLCAMCHWGVALGLGPNINMPMLKDNNEDAYTYAQKALALSENCTDKEKALIKALTTRYAYEAPEKRSGLDSTYAQEMRIVSQRFREDMDVATLFVESLMDCMPWQYWLPDGQPKRWTREAKAVLDYIAEKDPDHPGATHFYIHLVEEIRPELAVQSADRLADMEYPAGHLVHMPSHIYIRTGKYHEASTVNQEAMRLDEEYIEKCNAQGIYPASYYPHNIHFLWFAASMEGRGKVSIDAARKLVAKTPKSKVIKYPHIERYMTIPYFSLVRFGKWDEILREPKPDKELLYSAVMWHYARGMAYSKKGKVRKAKKELRLVQKGITHEAIVSVNRASYPTINLTKMAALVLEAEIEGRQGNTGQKVKLLKEAVAIQDGLVYDEPPFFYYPIRQSLGAALLEHGDASGAEDAFREDLAKFPVNGWSLFGLHQSLMQQQKLEEAQEVKIQFDKAWSSADVALEGAVM